jgi:hypothetical protein
MIIEDIQDINYLEDIYNVIDNNTHYAYTVDLRFNKSRWDDVIIVIENRDQKYK